MIEKKTRISVILIHNFDAARNQSALSQLELLRNISGKTEILSTLTIGWQPPLLPVDFSTFVLKELQTLIHLIRWYKYLGIGNSPSKGLSPVFGSVARLLLSPISFKSEARRRAVEIELSLKHVRAWESFLETDAEWLLVVEDDIVLVEKPNSAFIRLERLVEDVDSVTPCFFSVSSPYSVLELNAAALVSSIEDQVTEFTRPISNTTAGYVVSRRAAELFVVEFRRSYSLRFLNADLMINEIFIRLSKLSQNFKALHFNPEIFKNGTMSGHMESSIR